jgi:periplasmic protein TonB
MRLFQVAFILLSFLFMEKINAQQDSISMKDKGVVFEIEESQAEYPGGQAVFFKYLNENIKMPSNPLNLIAYIRVVVKFVVEKDGSVTNVAILEEENKKKEVLKNIKKANSSIFKPFSDAKKAATEKVIDDFFAEAKRVITAQPKWKPGMQRDNPVRSYFSMPVTYTMH